MVDSLRQWASNPETWFNLFLGTFLFWIVTKAFASVRAFLLRFAKKIARKNRDKAVAFSQDDALTYKCIASREAWLIIFILGSLSWFAYVALSPLSQLLSLGTSITLLTMSPVWVLEVLFLSRDTFTNDVLEERKS